ncbi:MAG: YitT family protein [Prevotella sp.]|nr:YitT family protein [Prevotella sp.]
MTINQQLIRSEAKDYLFLTMGLLLYAVAFTIFLLPYEIVTGGVTGMSAIVYYATGFKIENTYMIINISLLVVALKILGFKFMMKTIYAIFALYFMLKFAQDLMPVDSHGHFIKVLGEGQDFMSLIIGCCITGTGLAIVFLNNGSTGGTDIIAACVNKYRDISLGQVLMGVDILIVGSCLFFPQFGSMVDRLHKMVFGYCTMFIECFMLDHVMNMRRESVQFLIFSWKHEEIAKAIVDETEHALTILDGHGWYTGNDMKVICLLAKKNESKTIFRLIKMVDPTAFVSQSSVIGVYGEGFDQIKIKAKKDKKKQIEKQIEAAERASVNKE